MTCALGRHVQLAMWILLSSALGMPWALSLKGMHGKPEQARATRTVRPSTRQNKPEPFKPEQARDHRPTKKSTHFSGEKLGNNVKIYEPMGAVHATASLILLMGYGGDLSWTMTQWWYLDPAWSSSNQEWCRNDAQYPCAFGESDRANAQHLTNSLRIVDAVGNIDLWKKYGAEGHAWYDYDPWPDGPPFADELEKAIAIVFRLIEHEYKVLGDYQRIAIAGMSQGADLALEVGIRFPQQLGMVFSQRGMLRPSRRQGNQTLAAHPGTPFILVGGNVDELIPLQTFKASCASLQRMSAPAYFKGFQGLNHGSFSMPEWKLMIQAWSLMLSSDPWIFSHGGYGIQQIDQLAWWDSCTAG